uniref:Uncharacterized protein n=1 Tax=Candidatus Kentrum sp. SD TaxID=2126332 RepID=A0A450Y5B6_9GAMM|nr:MAG: hypothetical protein BECKSD772F_GA0070984_100449 [Candidatus Kentron sp. SD]VFK40282.1 MAG: hypothetical protein BECKSD772E_GA0070983_100549 [Candidatus Kentron sp. SD]VFK78566.1 MAG: hypothetical protein BECKSD772D_GA0070982_101811 [Candidatus Kentron sp. SD]
MEAILQDKDYSDKAVLYMISKFSNTKWFDYVKAASLRWNNSNFESSHVIP